MLQVIVLHLYLASAVGGTTDSADVKARIDQLYDRVRGLCYTRGYNLVDGSRYQEPGAQQAARATE